MQNALILGGTKGLGRSLAKEALARNMRILIVGRSVERASADPTLQGSQFCNADIRDAERSPKHIIETGWRCMPGDTWAPTDQDFVVWNVGVLVRKPLADCALGDIDYIFETNLRGPVAVLIALHRFMAEIKRPYHLITIASTSSWRMRDNEALYCASKAAQAHFTRNFARELVRDLPGSRATLINPAGMKTELFGGTGQDTSKFMDPDAVARIIWDEVLSQEINFEEIQIMRNDEGVPCIERGPRAPEQPF